jgi:hypothetical protein
MLSLFVPTAYASDWGGNCVSNGVATIGGIECVVNKLLVPLPGLIALAAVFMIIFAGVRIISSGSDPKALSAAMTTLTWAIVGLILLSVSWLALVLIEKFTGAKVTDFGIPASP